jgi:hypothetical protein
MAFVLGLAVALLVLRLFLALPPTTPPSRLGLSFLLASAPAGFLLAFLDQRFRKQIWYMAAAGAGATLAMVTTIEWSGDAAQFLPACAVTYFLLLWLAGLAGAGLGLLASRACYRLVIQDGALCPRCAYRLIGLPSQVCPECGREFTYQELGTTAEHLQAAAREVENVKGNEPGGQ